MVKQLKKSSKSIKDLLMKTFKHHGVILLRLEDERTVIKIETLTQLLRNYPDRLTGQFIVVTESRVRFASKR